MAIEICTQTPPTLVKQCKMQPLVYLTYNNKCVAIEKTFVFDNSAET